jgi:hypothetical protein
MYRFFANFWSVVFCVFEGAFVEQNLISAISVFEADAKASGPIFMHDAFIRLRVILQSSCRSRDLSTQNDKQAIQLTLDDADFEGIPLHLQVGLLACRGMMLLHNGTYFSNGFFESELVDIPALHLYVVSANHAMRVVNRCRLLVLVMPVDTALDQDKSLLRIPVND